MFCDKGCYETGCILYSDEYNAIIQAEKKNRLKLEQYEAYRAIASGDDFGHINYALPAYCVFIGHNHCLKKLHKTVDLMWHNDLAKHALFVGNIEAYQYIIQEMGDVDVPTNN